MTSQLPVQWVDHMVGKFYSLLAFLLGNAKECSNHCKTALISHASKVMLKILHARLQQYVNQEFPDVQAGFRISRGIRDQIANIHWNIKKEREFQKNIYFCFIDYTKAFDCVDLNKLWEILKEMRIPDHLTCLLRNLYAGQEATVRTGHGTTDWFQIGKGVCQSCIWPCLFNLHTYSCLENPVDRGAWWAAAIGSHRVGHDRSDLACMHALEKEMATYSSILAWRIPGTEEPGGLLPLGSHRVRHDWSNLAAAAAEYIIRKAELDEAQAGIKIAGRNINILQYADDTTLMQKVKN